MPSPAHETVLAEHHGTVGIRAAAVDWMFPTFQETLQVLYIKLAQTLFRVTL